MSPAVIGAAPWYAKIFGGRQRARTLHFAGLLAFLSFVLVHTAMVVVHGVGSGMAKIVLADPAADGRLAIVIGAAGVALVILIHVAGTFFARRDPRAAQLLLAPVVDFIERQLSSRLRSRQAYPRWAISPYHWVNGRPPNGVPARVELSVEGLVEHPLRLSVDDLRAMPVHSQVVLHNCIQGWSAVAEWTGVSLSELLDRAGPLPGARYVAFWAIDGSYYETLPLEIARRNQSILAYSMNGRPLPLEHGAPLRLRVENQLGFKMVKWLARIELVDDFRKLGQGQGGWREDHMQYSRLAGI
jgi:DMSO/TMAO reductase YedYZ molybdopterin-dependent catalytic subunit